ncbi:MAG: MFS transporter [Gammaproteobacteria bacterium]
MRVIAFGFVLTLSSVLGQTHFVSLFNASLRADFALSHGELGALYSAATLVAALFLPWLGRLIDSTDLRIYAAFVIGGLAAATCALALSAAWWHLALAFFLMRLFGQGLSSHTGIVTTARLATKKRGRALSLTGLGFSAGEAFAPPIVAAALMSLHWRELWLAAAAGQMILIMLAAQFLLSRLPHKPPLAQGLTSGGESDDNPSWTRHQVLRDGRFWRAAPALFAPAFIVTALLFHQNSLADYKNADFIVWSSAIAAYSLAAVGASLAGGFLTDKFGGARVAKFALLPLIAAVLLPLTMDGALLPFAYYALAGAGVGLSLPTANALWAEVYGTKHLGAVRALTQALTAFFSAGGPVIYGLMLDAGLGWHFILPASALWMTAAALLFALTPMKNRPPPK